MMKVTFADELPLCPHCSRPLETVNAIRLQHDLGKAYVHSCPSCRKVIGISHRKGFWMG